VLDLTAFASPEWQIARSVPDIVPELYFAQTRDRLTERLRGFNRTLAGAVESIGRPAYTCWRPEVGLAASALKAGRADLAALQLLVTAPQVGAGGSQVNLSHAGPLLIDGRLLHAEGHMSVEACSRRSDSAWPVFPMSGSGPRYVVDSGLPGYVGVFPWPRAARLRLMEPRPNHEDRASAVIGVLTRALDLIRTECPPFWHWLEGVVDGFLLTNSRAFTGVSSPDFPGLVAIGISDSEVEYVELLATQVCHQRMFQLLLVAGMTAGENEEIHYLDARRSYVTTRRMLAAVHEHVNVIRLLLAIDWQGDQKEVVHRQVQRRLLALNAHALPIVRKSRTLSEQGRALGDALETIASSL